MSISLMLLKKDGTKKVFPVRNKATILGRRPDCDLCIPLQVISRRHCQLSVEGQSLKIRDLRSSNGTFLNSQKVGDEIEAKPGDRLQVGPLTFTIQIDGQPARPSVPDDELPQPSPDISGASEEEMNRSGTFIT
ncbi:MAG: FHA domain-containing protein [Phycisphaerae bacterium]|nr:FHA domain-containing protein [Phycisphaerae bacterium]